MLSVENNAKNETEETLPTGYPMLFIKEAEG
jgi:hypothetical protein